MSWVLIEHQALTSSVASVTLGSGGTIPQTYKSLMLLITARTSPSFTSLSYDVFINGATSSPNNTRVLSGNGSTAASEVTTSRTWATAASATSNTFSNSALIFSNYTSSSSHKVISMDTVTENNATAATQALQATLWADNNPITSITLSRSDFVSGSTFTLYGLRA